jgi:uncharacterized phage protein (TIGR01671 family)
MNAERQIHTNMRELKFRGKLLKDSDSFKTYKKGTIIQGGFCTQGSKTFIVAHFNIFEVEPESVSQFTGSIDKNGVEIFENDTVRLEEGFSPRERKIVFSHYGTWMIGRLGIGFDRMKANGFVYCEVITT